MSAALLLPSRAHACKWNKRTRHAPPCRHDAMTHRQEPAANASWQEPSVILRKIPDWPKRHAASCRFCMFPLTCVRAKPCVMAERRNMGNSRNIAALVAEIAASRSAFEQDFAARRQRLEQATAERGPEVDFEVAATPPDLRLALLVARSGDAYRWVMESAVAQAERELRAKADAEAKQERQAEAFFEKLAAEHKRAGFHPRPYKPLPSERMDNGYSRRRPDGGK